MRVLIACEESGVMRRAFDDLGHDVQDIAGFPNYAVTHNGNILSLRRPRGKPQYFRALSPSADAKGYLCVALCRDGIHASRRVHRIVAEAFHENPLGLPCVRHLDGNPKNNHANNLAWGTYAENEEDKRLHGTWDLRRNGKLSREHVLLARSLARDGESQKAIAERFGVSRPTITRLLNGTIWGNIA